MKQKLLEVKNLEIRFRTENGLITAVKNINFTLHRGETLGIVGESGSGKSVTSLAIMRLLAGNGQIAQGEMLFYPENDTQVPIDLAKLDEKTMQTYRGNQVAMIFQEPMTSLNPVLTCGYQVAEAIMLHQKVGKHEAKKQVLALFEKVKLPEPERIYNSYPHQISGGQKQRVMIAMAMSCNPAILFADEPTTALDVTVQQRILELLNDLKEDFGASIIFITHDLGVIAEIADHVLVMYKGSIVESGTAEAIFHAPQHPYTKGLLACRPPLDFRVRKLPIVSDFMEVQKASDGTTHIIEKNQSIQTMLEGARVSDTETQERLARLHRGKQLLQVENLCTWFPKEKNWWGKPLSYTKAVDDVSFDVFEGETLGLVGESGCGKTTLSRTLLRLIPATSGKIWYDGKDLLSLSDAEMRTLRRDIQIIFQDPYSSLNPRMTIGNAIMEPMQVHGILENDRARRNRTLELLETVNLDPNYFDRYPHEFSGGQRQRVVIARALALNPKFIICDECVSALDVSVQAQVLNLLMDLREKFKLTYIFISHDLSVVKLMSDRIMVMYKGKVEEIGTADDIYLHPQTAYTQKLIAAIPKGKR